MQPEPVPTTPHDAAVIEAHSRRLFVIQALLWASAGVSATLASIVVLRATGQTWLVGLPAALSQLTGAAVALPAGRLMDRHGRRPGIILALACGAAGFALAGLAAWLGDVASFLVGMALVGAGSGMGQLVRAAASDMYAAADRARGVGRVVAGGAAGAVVGPLLVPALTPLAAGGDAPALILPWFGAALLQLVGIGLALALRPDPKDIARTIEAQRGRGRLGDPPGAGPIEAHQGDGDRRPSHRPGAAAAPIRPRPIRELYRLAPARAATLTHACAQTVMSMVMAAGPAVMSLHGYGLPVISVIMTAHFLGMFALATTIGRWCDRAGRRRVLLGAGLVSAASGLVFPLTLASRLVAGTAFAAVGLGWSLAFVAATAVLADITTPDERSALLGANDLLTRVGAVVGSLVSGTVVLGGPAVAGLIVLVLALVPLPWVLRLREPVPGTFAPPVPAAGAPVAGRSQG